MRIGMQLVLRPVPARSAWAASPHHVRHNDDSESQSLKSLQSPCFRVAINTSWYHHRRRRALLLTFWSTRGAVLTAHSASVDFTKMACSRDTPYRLFRATFACVPASKKVARLLRMRRAPWPRLGGPLCGRG